MKEYLVLFKPVGAYFFGNEKVFSFSDEDSNRYYIKSENMPSQSGILGAIRYMLLPVKKSDWSYTEEELKTNNAAVGEYGFNPESEAADYGKINKISPVFIMGENGAIIRTPFDHIEGNEFYTPFSKYETVDVAGKYYSVEYNSKDGVSDSYMQVLDGRIIPTDSIFKGDIRIGINRFSKERGFFKKEYKTLLNGLSFAVYLSLDDETAPQNGIVYMGQGKSAFSVTFTEQKNTLCDDIRKHLRSDVVYCASNAFVDSEIYEETFFAVTKTKTYRHFQKNKNKVKKGGVLYNTIEAGSIFIPRNEKEFFNKVTKESLSKAGYNIYVSGGEEK